MLCLALSNPQFKYLSRVDVEVEMVLTLSKTAGELIEGGGCKRNVVVYPCVVIPIQIGSVTAHWSKERSTPYYVYCDMYG